MLPEIEAAANALGRRLEVLTASSESDLEAAFGTMVQHRIDSLIVMADPFLISRREQLGTGSPPRDACDLSSEAVRRPRRPDELRRCP
jgi:hypothetical protein